MEGQLAIVSVLVGECRLLAIHAGGLEFVDQFDIDILTFVVRDW